MVYVAGYLKAELLPIPGMKYGDDVGGMQSKSRCLTLEVRCATYLINH